MNDNLWFLFSLDRYLGWRLVTLMRNPPGTQVPVGCSFSSDNGITRHIIHDFWIVQRHYVVTELAYIINLRQVNTIYRGKTSTLGRHWGYRLTVCTKLLTPPAQHIPRSHRIHFWPSTVCSERSWRCHFGQSPCVHRMLNLSLAIDSLLGN